MRTENLFFLVLFLSIVTSLGAVAVYGTVHARANVECLSHGYPKAIVDMYLNAYCVRRVDQTDVVEPLEKVRRERS